MQPRFFLLTAVFLLLAGDALTSTLTPSTKSNGGKTRENTGSPLVTHKPDSVCVQLEAAFQQNQVLLVGVLEEKLIFLTKSSPEQVFFAPLANLSTASLTMDTVATKLSEKWPAIGSNTGLKDAFSQTEGAISLKNGSQWDLIFITKFDSATGLITWTATVKPSPSVSQKSFPIDTIDLPNTLWISSSEQTTFYTIILHKEVAKYKTMAKWSWVKEGKFVESKSSHVLCISGKGKKLEVTFKDTICQGDENNWSQLHAIAVKGHLYLFGPDAVIIFPMEAFEKPGSAKPLKKVLYSDLLHCPVEADPMSFSTDGNGWNNDSDSTVSTISSGGHGITIVAIVIVIIIVAAVVVALWYFFFYNKDGGSKSGKKESSNIQMYMQGDGEEGGKKNDEDDGALKSSADAGGSSAKVGGGGSSTQFNSSSAKQGLKGKNKTRAGGAGGSASARQGNGDGSSSRSFGKGKGNMTISGSKQAKKKRSSASKRTGKFM